MDNPIRHTRATQLRATVAGIGRRIARMLRPYSKVIGKALKRPLLSFFLRTLLPVALTSCAGYVETQAKKDQLFRLLENYREYIIEVEGQSPPCPPMEEDK